MPANNEEFIKKAFEAGLTEDRVRSAVAERNQRLKTTQQPIDDRNFAVKALDAIAPATANIARDWGAGDLVTKMETSGANKQSQAWQQQLIDLAKRAQVEKDPIKKAKLLEIVKKGMAENQNVNSMNQVQFSEDAGKNYLRRGLAAGTELGTLLAPGPSGSNALQRIGSAATTGAFVTGSRELTNLEGVDENLLSGLNADRVINTAEAATVGAITGAGLQTGIEGINFTGSKIKDAAKWLRDKGYEAYATTFKDNQKALELIGRKYGNDPTEVAKKFVNAGIPNTKNGVIKEVQKMNQQYDSEISNKLKLEGNKSGKVIDFQSVIDDVKSDIEKYFHLPKDQASKEAAMSYLEQSTTQLEKSMLPESANRLRINYDKNYISKPLGEITPNDLVDKLIANKLRGSVQDAVGATKPFFKKYSMLKDAELLFYKEPKWGFNELLGWLATNNPIGAIAARTMKSPGATRAVSSQLTRLPAFARNLKVSSGVPAPLRNLGVERMDALVRAKNQ